MFTLQQMLETPVLQLLPEGKLSIYFQLFSSDENWVRNPSRADFFFNKMTGGGLAS